MQRIFPRSTILLTPTVSKEIARGINIGILGYPKIRFSRTKLDLSEKRLVRELRERKRLGLADAECIAVAKNRKCVLLTNDREVQREADSLSVNHMSLSLLLRELWRTKIITKHQVIELIKEIEEKDRIVMKNKGLILG